MGCQCGAFIFCYAHAVKKKEKKEEEGEERRRTKEEGGGRRRRRKIAEQKRCPGRSKCARLCGFRKIENKKLAACLPSGFWEKYLYPNMK